MELKRRAPRSAAPRTIGGVSRRYAAPGMDEITRWYFRTGQGRRVAASDVPFYCDPTGVGHFAVSRQALALGDDDAVFRLFVTLAMYQALRDEVIRQQQRALRVADIRVLVDVGFIGRAIARHDCPAFASVVAFERECSVGKTDGIVDCHRCPGTRCHVKDATVAFNRMGDMGKLPSSAWLRIWKDGGPRKVLADVCCEEQSPTRRAELLVERFANVHRIGRKLATMFVSALSTPTLAPGLTPWFPEVDGNELVVVDTNVARAVDALRPAGASKTYDARAAWVRDQARRIDLHELHPDAPRYSPRLVQEALYTFCSKSNGCRSHFSIV